MAESRPTYVKLTGRNRRFTGSSQVWISADESHLLLVRTVWFVEHYSRFRLRDIQAVIVHARDLLWPVHALVIIAVAVLAVFLIHGASSGIGKAILGVLFAPVLIGLIVNLARGSKASVTLVTAVSRTMVPAITRLNRAEDFVMVLTPLIQASQAGLPVAPGREGLSPAPAREMPELPGATPPVAISAVLYGSVLLAGVISLAVLYRRIPEAIANLSWTLTAAGAALGFYVAVVEHRAFGARILSAISGAVSLAALAISAAATISFARGKNPPLPAGIPDHFAGFPLWFVEYSRLTAPVLTMLGIIGVAMTVSRAFAGDRESR